LPLAFCAFCTTAVVAACDSSVNVEGGLKGTAIAMTREQVDEIPAAQPVAGASPEDLQLQVSNRELTCGTFGFATGGCFDQWVATFEIAPSMQKPGVYPIGDLVDSGIASEFPDGTSCPRASVGFVSGTFEVLEIDDAHVRYKVTTDPVTYAEGEHTAARCP
jgi:hypothetical protein